MLKPLLSALSLVIALPLALSPLQAQAVAQDQMNEVASPLDNRATDVLSLVQGQVEPEVVFAPQFLAAVPPAQFKALTDQLVAQFGEPISVENLQAFGPYKAAFDLRFERGIGKIEMALQPAEPFRISELLIRRVDPLTDDIAAIEAELRALPGEVGVYFGPLDGSNPRLAINADVQFAIGSTFKLYVLSALAREVDDKGNDKYWDSVISLGTDLCLSPPCEAEGRSFPSGITQEWPAPTPVTLQTAATLMISISDNTATDTLIEYLGEERIVKEMIESGHSKPELNQPFLTTRQMFALKAGGDSMVEAYRNADLEMRYELTWEAAEADIVQDDVERAFAGGPYALDIEWFASPHDLRRLWVRFPDTKWKTERKILQINPSALSTFFSQYPKIYYKGGSQPGVLNFTWLMEDVAGQMHVLTMSWNNPDAALQEERFEVLAQRLFSLLHKPSLSKELDLPL